MPQILLCCVLALLLAALGLLLRSLRRRSRPSGGNETLKVLLVCFFTCGILLHLPMYAAAYAGERFVRLLPEGEGVNIRSVRCSNYCDIQLYADPHTGLLIVTSVIDNMVKGAAGQAIQNANLLFGLPEDTGLGMAPLSF